MKKSILLSLALLAVGFAFAQQRPEVLYSPKISSIDSIVLFHSETDPTTNSDILKSRGFIRHSRYTQNGEA